VVGEEDLGALLGLVHGYLDFYEASPPDADILALSRALIADPEREGTQVLARDAAGEPVGFATVFWLWSTLRAARIALMNDLYVVPAARGSGTAEALIEHCRAAAAAHGAVSLQWRTAPDNRRAQTVYDRVGGRRSQWLDYDLDV